MLFPVFTDDFHLFECNQFVKYSSESAPLTSCNSVEIIFRILRLMLSLIEMRWRKLFLFLSLVLALGCREQKKELKDIILQSTEDIVDPALFQLNPQVRFFQVRIVNQTRRAAPYIPGEKLFLPVSQGRLNFYLGIIPEYFVQYPAPVEIKILARSGQAEQLVWKQTVGPGQAPGWRQVEIGLSGAPESLVFESDIRDYGLAITPFRRESSGKDKKPSVVFIIIDALRADHLGAYGYGRDTSPNLDALAANGALFLNAMSAAPFTVTSLASFFTGKNPWEHGVIFNDNLILDQKYATLAQRMREAGYATAGFSSTYFHLADFGLIRGFDFFDESCDKKFFSNDAECLSGQIADWMDARPETPFFLYVHFTPPHAPYYPPEPYRKLFSKGLTPPEDGLGKGDIRRFGPHRKWYQFRRAPAQNELDWLVSQYDGEIRYADDHTGLVLKKIGQAGLGQNTLIIITADHGEAFFEHGLMDHPDDLHWPVIRVPLIVAGPGIPAGARLNSLVRSIDLAPTILDFAGLPPLHDVAGKSLLPVLSGKEGEPRAGFSMLCQSRKKYRIGAVLYPYHLLVRAPGDKGIELYDLAADPLEKNNLASERPEIVKNLLELIPSPGQIQNRDKSKSGLPDQETVDRLRSLNYLK